MRVTNGPPVWNAKWLGPAIALPALDLMPALRSSAQRTPGGRSLSKSKAQVFSSIQRPLPAVADALAPLHVSLPGAAAPGLPNAVIGSSNFTTTCLTCVTLPCGETLATRAASARCTAALRLSAASTVVAAKIHFCLVVTRLIHLLREILDVGFYWSLTEYYPLDVQPLILFNKRSLRTESVQVAFTLFRCRMLTRRQ